MTPCYKIILLSFLFIPSTKLFNQRGKKENKNPENNSCVCHPTYWVLGNSGLPDPIQLYLSYEWQHPLFSERHKWNRCLTRNKSLNCLFCNKEKFCLSIEIFESLGKLRKWPCSKFSEQWPGHVHQEQDKHWVPVLAFLTIIAVFLVLLASLTINCRVSLLYLEIKKREK